MSDREKLIDVLVMTPMSDTAAAMPQVERTADAILASGWLRRVKAEAAAEALETAARDLDIEGFTIVAFRLKARAHRIRSEAGIGGGDGRG